MTSVNVMSARTMKYLLVMVISVAMVFATLGPALAATDISGHWAQTILEKWARDGRILGYPDGTMKPDKDVSRAEFVVFLNRALKAVNPNATSWFSDVQRGDWFYADVASAAAAGYVIGYEDGTFRPSAPITREESGVIVGRVLGLTAGDTSTLSSFKDSSAIASWAKGAAAALCAKGIMKGYEDGTFGPSRAISRAETVVILDRGIVEPAALVAAVPVIPYTGGGGGGYVVPSISTVSTVTATNGTVTVTLDRVPGTTPVIGDFAVTQTIGGGTATAVTPSAISTAAAVVTLTVPTVAAGEAQQSVVVSVRYKGGAAVPATAFTVAALPAPTISTVTATNGTVTVTLDRAPGMAPVIGDFAVTQTIGGGTATAVTPSAISTAAAVVTLTVPTVAAGEAQQSVVVSVRYKGGAAVPATAFTVAALPAPTISTVTATNGTVTVTLDRAPGMAPVIGDFAVTQTIGGGTATAVTPSAISTAAAVVTLTVPTVAAGEAQQSVVVSVRYKGGAAVPATAFTVAALPAPTVTVTLGNTASGIGKVATVTLSGYTGAAQYRLLKTDGTPLSGLVDVGSTVVVMFLNPGDSCKVEVYNATGAILETKTVTAVSIGQTGNATVTLGNTASGIGKVATVTLSGYTGAAQYRLLKTDGTPLSGRVDVGSTVVVMFLNPGDSCKVEVYNATGDILETKTVTTTGASAPATSATVTLANTASGIGKVATVTLSGYTGAAQYRLLKTDGTPLSGRVDVGSTVVVMFLNPGDSCKVEVYNATGDILETKTVTTTGAPATSATVTLANTASGIGKVATVTLSGYTSATQYRLLKADGTALTSNVNVGSTVVVMFLNPGDTCKVEVYSAGALIDTKTVTAQ
jgi:hypothetical protein